MWNFERSTIPKVDYAESCAIFPRNRHGLFTALFCIILAAFCTLYAPHWYIFVLIFPLARLWVLDATYNVLPNIYIAPLAAVGLALALFGIIPLQAALVGATAGFLACVTFALIAKIMNKNSMLGGGDVKFITAAGLYLGWQGLPFLILLACFICLPLALLNPKKPLPFGVGLVPAFSLLLLWHLS